MRINCGKKIDRSKKITFFFNNKKFNGFEGDTIASALLANDIYFTSRSIKYHRPRGVMSYGYEEPNTLFEVGLSENYEPNVLSTRVKIYEGIKIKSLNSWPSLNVDLFSNLKFFSMFLRAGFYYKTFFGSNFLWKIFFEPFLRKMAGFSKAPSSKDKSVYLTKNINCDVLIIGGGVAGIGAAYSMHKSKLDIILIEDDCNLLGNNKGENEENFINKILKDIKGSITIYNNTTVFGAYTDNYFAAIERNPSFNIDSSDPAIKERLLLIRAKKVVFATGAIERPIVFPNNDRPGIFLANAFGSYLNSFGVLLGRKIVLFTNNDYAYSEILNLDKSEIESIFVVDIRDDLNGDFPNKAKELNIPIYKSHVIVNAHGDKRIASVSIMCTKTQKLFTLDCDCLLVSGGFTPSLHLYAQQGGKILYEESALGFIPESNNQNKQYCVGSISGKFDFVDCYMDGFDVGCKILEEFNLKKLIDFKKPEFLSFNYSKMAPLWWIKSNEKLESKSFIDFQNDTTVADIRISKLEGFNNPEHIKRYTLNGFGTDQGKTGIINSLGIIAEMSNELIENYKPTTYRSPFVPVSFGALAGRNIGLLSDPIRYTALHDCHYELNAQFEDVGQWKRAWYYPSNSEQIAQAVSRECINVRSGVGILDASTLGKIEISGKDVVTFLNRVYTNDWSKLDVGKIKYGLILKEDGMVFDDGTTTRLNEDKYLMTTTTGNAALVLDWLEEWLQTEWPELDVSLTSVTDHWAVVTLSGPKSKDVILKLNPEKNNEIENLTFMSYKSIKILGIECRVFRISFTGELSYEINIPWPYATFLWKKLLEVGKDYNITPYGTETMYVLRAEKGFPIIGQDTDGTISPIELGMNSLLSKKDFIGKRSLSRNYESKKYFVGFKTLNPNIIIPEGSQIFKLDRTLNIEKIKLKQILKTNNIYSEGYITSSYFSPILNHSIALGFLEKGKEKINSSDLFFAIGDNNELIKVNIVKSVFYDPKGLRKNG